MTTELNIEAALKSLAGARKRIAVVYDADNGWCVTDDIDTLKAKMGAQAPEYRVIAYKDWFCKTLTDAVAMLGKIHGLRGKAESDMNRR